MGTAAGTAGGPWALEAWLVGTAGLTMIILLIGAPAVFLRRDRVTLFEGGFVLEAGGRRQVALFSDVIAVIRRSVWKSFTGQHEEFVIYRRERPACVFRGLLARSQEDQVQRIVDTCVAHVVKRLRAGLARGDFYESPVGHRLTTRTLRIHDRKPVDVAVGCISTVEEDRIYVRTKEGQKGFVVATVTGVDLVLAAILDAIRAKPPSAR